jgi:hypothetical protein
MDSLKMVGSVDWLEPESSWADPDASLAIHWSSRERTFANRWEFVIRWVNAKCDMMLRLRQGSESGQPNAVVRLRRGHGCGGYMARLARLACRNALALAIYFGSFGWLLSVGLVLLIPCP